MDKIADTRHPPRAFHVSSRVRMLTMSPSVRWSGALRTALRSAFEQSVRNQKHPAGRLIGFADVERTLVACLGQRDLLRRAASSPESFVFFHCNRRNAVSRLRLAEFLSQRHSRLRIGATIDWSDRFLAPALLEAGLSFVAPTLRDLGDWAAAYVARCIESPAELSLFEEIEAEMPWGLASR